MAIATTTTSASDGNWVPVVHFTSPDRQLFEPQSQQQIIKNYANDFFLSPNAITTNNALMMDNFLFLSTSNNSSQNNNNNNGSSNCRSTKSQSKQRRDLINAELNHVRDLLPLSKSSRQRLSQLQVMACNNCYIRKCNYWLTAPLERSHAYRRDETLFSFEFGKAMSSFYIICTSNGKLLTIGDNTIDALGQSFEDLLAHGDSLHDLIYREDVLALRSMLELWPENAIMRTTLVRINPARSVRRQGKYGEFKVIFVRGYYTRLTSYYIAAISTNEPVFVAECTPLLSPENREVLLHTSTELFVALIDRRGELVGVDERACMHLDVARTDLLGCTVYDLIEDEESLREMQQIHKRILVDGEEQSAWALLRLRVGNYNPQNEDAQNGRASPIYVHALLQQQPPSLSPPSVLANTALRKTNQKQQPSAVNKRRRRRGCGRRSQNSDASDADESEDDENGDAENDDDDDEGEGVACNARGQNVITTPNAHKKSATLYTLTCQVLSASEALLLQHNRQLIYTPPPIAAPPLNFATSINGKNFDIKLNLPNNNNNTDDDREKTSENEDENDDDELLPQLPPIYYGYHATLPASSGFVLHDEINHIKPQFVPAFLLPNNNLGSMSDDAAAAAAYLAALNVNCSYVPLPPTVNMQSVVVNLTPSCEEVVMNSGGDTPTSRQQEPAAISAVAAGDNTTAAHFATSVQYQQQWLHTTPSQTLIHRHHHQQQAAYSSNQNDDSVLASYYLPDSSSGGGVAGNDGGEIYSDAPNNPLVEVNDTETRRLTPAAAYVSNTMSVPARRRPPNARHQKRRSLSPPEYTASPNNNSMDTGHLLNLQEERSSSSNFRNSIKRSAPRSNNSAKRMSDKRKSHATATTSAAVDVAASTSLNNTASFTSTSSSSSMSSPLSTSSSSTATAAHMRHPARGAAAETAPINITPAASSTHHQQHGLLSYQQQQQQQCESHSVITTTNNYYPSGFIHPQSSNFQQQQEVVNNSKLRQLLISGVAVCPSAEAAHLTTYMHPKENAGDDGIDSAPTTTDLYSGSSYLVLQQQYNHGGSSNSRPFIEMPYAAHARQQQPPHASSSPYLSIIAAYANNNGHHIEDDGDGDHNRLLRDTTMH